MTDLETLGLAMARWILKEVDMENTDYRSIVFVAGLMEQLKQIHDERGLPFNPMKA